MSSDNQLDLEVSIYAQKFVEQGMCGQDAYDKAIEELDVVEGLRQELHQINNRITELEYGDDFLFTNMSGNFSEYQKLKERASEIAKELKELQA